MATSEVQLDAHIPVTLQGPLLVMSYDEPCIGKIATIFVGIVNESYTDAMWDAHKKRLTDLFDITDPSCMKEIKVESRGERQDQINSGKLLEQWNATLKLINQWKPKILRIIGLGVGSAEVVVQALESLIQRWDIAREDKHVQFISLGESRHFYYLNFCRSLCMKQICKTLQYYNTMDYNPFGYLRTAMGDPGNDVAHPFGHLMSRLQSISESERTSGVQTPSTASVSSLGLR